MNALAKDPRFKFPDNDAGRAEIHAYIQTWLGKIRAELPRAFRTLVKGNVAGTLSECRGYGEDGSGNKG